PNIKHNPDSDSVVSISASSYLSDFDRKANRHTNHTEQTQRFPNDNFFKPFGTVNRDIVWGRET
ncbi:MAG TPA: hypothetical protein DCM40_20945, partial [Maribacter sp.]|nr:hypothetical protein [Maribacter sp.]